MKIYQAKCFYTTNVKFSGSAGDLFFYMLHFSIVKCTNKTICKSPKQIDEALKLCMLSIAVSQNYFDFESFDQPIKTEISYKQINIED